MKDPPSEKLYRVSAVDHTGSKLILMRGVLFDSAQKFQKSLMGAFQAIEIEEMEPSEDSQDR